MKQLNITSALLVLLLSLPSTGVAQERVPHTGSAAGGFEVGTFFPGSDELSSSVVVNGLYEYYLTPRVSVRASFGWADPRFSTGAVNSLSQMPLTVSGEYNWEGGKWHPFVGAGAGLYFLRFTSDVPSTDNTDTRFGLNTGGGMEYFVSKTVSVKGEGRYHFIQDARGEEPSGFAMTAGVKTYF